MNESKKFEVGKTYTDRSACDCNCVFSGKVIKRTASTVTFDCGDNGIRTVRINKVLTQCLGGIECVYPLGQYSMAPTFQADKFAA